MNSKFPDMPNAVFNIEKWFKNTFTKNYSTGKTIGYDFKYEDHYNLFLHAKFIVEEKVVNIVNAFDEKICTISRDEYNNYISHGEWDDLSFTENERKLAWRIECLHKLLLNDKINRLDFFKTIKNKSDSDNEFDFGFYEFYDSDNNNNNNNNNNNIISSDVEQSVVL